MKSTVLNPDDACRLVPALVTSRNPELRVYRYEDAKRGWVLAVATHARPNAAQLSLGGFRIAPAERMARPGFTPEREAIELAIGMEDKVWWSRVTGIGGPRARSELSRIVGGKCVLAPTPGSRVGEPGDTDLLDFAITALHDLEERVGVHPVTGQDLGHGTLHTGDSSLAYLNDRYRGSVLANTSLPTGEGNLQLLLGMLRGLGLAVGDATVGLVGCGNIGMRVLGRLRELGATVLAVESNPARRAELAALGIDAHLPADRLAFLAQPMDALVVNALGGSLDAPAVAACVANERLRVVCGSENLAMPDPAQAEVLRAAGRIYAPTELGGMMGYLTALEEYLARAAGEPFAVESLFPAAEEMEQVGHDAVRRVVQGGWTETFEDAVVALHPAVGR